MEPWAIPPMDPHNQELIHNVHPPDWENPQPASCYNLIAIGGGAAGLVSAAGAAGLGAKAALIERHLLGGDCLNTGCVPSKALIRSARAVADVREAERFGVRVPPGTAVDFAAVMERMRAIRAHISRHDAAERFRGLGLDIFFGQASFTSPNTIAVQGRQLLFKKAVIATGARPTAPPIPGLAAVGYLTSETIFQLTVCPPRLACIGAGPIGCELAQAMQRLGSQVTLLESAKQILGKEDPQAAGLVQQALERDGVRLVLGASLRRVERTGDGIQLLLEENGQETTLSVDQILVAAGRAPNIEDLNLDAAGVRADRSGILVNDYLQTTNPNIFAAGDVCLPWQFTHAADAAARLVIQNALFFGRKKASALQIPWCIYTDPEIAHVGLDEAQARQQGLEVETLTRYFREVDRALTDGEAEGFVRVHLLSGSDRILGATIVSRQAGDLIGELALAMGTRTGLCKLAGIIHPYPTRAEAIRQLGDIYNRSRLKPGLKQWLEAFMSFRRG